MLPRLAIAVVGGVFSFMALSPIFTPVIHFYWQPKVREEAKAEG